MIREPRIIQGGMGVAVSGWKLASSVSKLGQLGVVSGTALDTVLLRRLQSGDSDGSIRRALQAFGDPRIAKNIIRKYYLPLDELKPPRTFAHLNLPKAKLTREHLELLVLASFVEVYLAKESHHGLVGINFLEKIRYSTLPSLYGAMLAGVDYVLMGAGIPRYVPAILDLLANHLDVQIQLDVLGASAGDHFTSDFSPSEFSELTVLQKLKRPKFLPIVSSSVLAATLLRKSEGEVNGFIVETSLAGGHNAPPRGKLELSELGEPVYGVRDAVDLSAMRDLKVPFWLAGSYGSRDGLKKAQEVGASGIQVGTAFALAEESGLDASLKQQLIDKALKGTLKIFTDPRASPTEFPFKVAELEGSLSDERVYQERPRVCNLGYLRQIYKREDGNLGYRCPSEPIDAYLKKGGKVEETHGRKCLCNALLANIGLAQSAKDYLEKPLVTLGNDTRQIASFLKPNKVSYSARDVIESILSLDHALPIT